MLHLCPETFFLLVPFLWFSGGRNVDKSNNRLIFLFHSPSQIQLPLSYQFYLNWYPLSWGDYPDSFFPVSWSLFLPGLLSNPPGLSITQKVSVDSPTNSDSMVPSPLWTIQHSLSICFRGGGMKINHIGLFIVFFETHELLPSTKFQISDTEVSVYAKISTSNKSLKY